MKKFLTIIFVLCVALLVPVMASAKTDDDVVSPELPKSRGDYAVPGHKNLRLRVIDHPVKLNAGRSGSSMGPCTDLDKDSFATVSTAPWKLKSSTTFRVNPSTFPSGIAKDTVSKALANAFLEWDQHLTPVAFTRGNDTGVTKVKYDGQWAVFFGRLSSSAIATTYIWYDSTGYAAEIDMVFNSRYKWSFTPYYDPATGLTADLSTLTCGVSTFDIQDIATHEVGHWVGLEDMYGVTDADLTMYGYGDYGEVHADTLTTGDISAAGSRYNL